MQYVCRVGSFDVCGHSIHSSEVMLSRIHRSLSCYVSERIQWISCTEIVCPNHTSSCVCVCLYVCVCVCVCVCACDGTYRSLFVVY